MKSFLVALVVLGVGVVLLTGKYQHVRIGPTASQPGQPGQPGSMIVVLEKGAPGAPKEVPPAELKAAPIARLTGTGDLKFPTWQVVSKWEATKNDALQSALAAAQTELTDYVRTQEPPLEWTPTLDFVTKISKVAKDETHNFDQDSKVQNLVGEMRRITLDVKVTPQARQEMWQHDREFRSQARMLWLAKLLAALVAGLAATAGYFRMDDMTKGYYSGWLRLAAAGFVGGAAVVVLLLA